MLGNSYTTTSSSAAYGLDQSINSSRSSRFRGPKLPQSGIVHTMLPNSNELERRKNTSTDAGYPDGGVIDNMHVVDGELVLALVTGTRAQLLTFTSLNGLSFGDSKSVEELEQKIRFCGQALSDHRTLNEMGRALTQPHGFGCLMFGSTSRYDTYQYDIYPGDTLVYRLMTLPEAKKMVTKGNTHGVSRSKLLPIIGPLDWSSVQYQLHAVVKHMLLNDGVFNIPTQPIYLQREYFSSLGGTFQKASIALKQNTLVTAMRAIEPLANRGIVKIITPKQRQIDDSKQIYLRKMGKLANAIGSLGPMDTENLPDVTDVKEVIKYVAAVYEEYVEKASSSDYKYEKDNRFTNPSSFYTHGLQFSEDTDDDALSERLFKAQANDKAGLLTEKHIFELDKVLWLARSLGVIKDVTEKNASYNMRVVQDVLNSVYVVYAEPGVKEKHITGSVIKDKNYQTPQLTHDLKNYLDMYMNHVYELQKAMNIMRQHVENKKIGTAMNYVPGGNSLETILDFIVRGSS